MRTPPFLFALGSLALLFGPAPAALAQLTVTEAAAPGYDGANAYFGAAAVPIGDLDGNGTGDYAVGVPRAGRAAEAEAGLVRILLMSTPTAVGSTVVVQPAVLLAGDRFGSALAVVSTAPLRLAVGAPGMYDSATNATAPAVGAVFVLTLNAAGVITATDRIDDADLPALAEDDQFGGAIAVLSGTAGAARLVVGAPGDNCAAGFNCGAAYVLTYTGVGVGAVVVNAVVAGAGAGGVTTAVAGLSPDDALGSALAASAAGSPQALFLGAPGADAAGPERGRVYHTTVTGANAVGAFTAYDGASAPLATLANSDRFGAALATPISGAGYTPDVLVGAPGTGGARGRFWVLDLTGTTLAATRTSGTAAFTGGLYGAALAVPGRAVGYAGVDVATGVPGGTAASAGEGRLSLNALSGDVLPVELASFTARADGPAVRLAWTTASETNNAGFGVEVSAARDGDREDESSRPSEWRELGWVPGHGTTAEARAYAFDVPALDADRYRFRLRQVDADGAARYSAEVEAQAGVEGRVSLSVSPSPARGAARVRVAVREAGAVRVEVYDALGRRVAVLAEGPFEAQRTQTFVLDAGALPAGTYVVRVAGEGVRAARSFVVVR